MPKDFLGKELSVGDDVVFMQVRYRSLKRGVIASMSEQTCVIKHEKTNLGDTETRQFYKQVVKV